MNEKQKELLTKAVEAYRSAATAGVTEEQFLDAAGINTTSIRVEGQPVGRIVGSVTINNQTPGQAQTSASYNDQQKQLLDKAIEAYKSAATAGVTEKQFLEAAGI